MGEAKPRARTALALCSLLVGALGCSRDTRAPAADPDGVAGLPGLQAPDTGMVALAYGASGWRLRPLLHLPSYFELSGWKDDATLFGRAGCNPVEVEVDRPEYRSWDVSACGSAALAPGSARAAWGDGQGAILVGERGAEPLTLRRAGAPSPSGEGDPTGLALWSPDGARLLLSWAAEGEPTFAVADLASGQVEPVTTRAEGYFLTRPWGWLDGDRLLFVADASRSLTGASEYRESSGYRSDLAVLDLRSGAYRTVTAVPDDTFLHPIASWGGGSLLVAERRDGVLERYWAYDKAAWQRRPVPLPRGGALFVADSSRVALLGIVSGETSPLTLWQTGRSLPLAAVRLRQPVLAWSPDGRRLAIAGSFDEPLPDQGPGSFVTRYAAYVLEPR